MSPGEFRLRNYAPAKNKSSICTCRTHIPSDETKLRICHNPTFLHKYIPVVFFAIFFCEKVNCTSCVKNVSTTSLDNGIKPILCAIIGSNNTKIQLVGDVCVCVPDVFAWTTTSSNAKVGTSEMINLQAKCRLTRNVILQTDAKHSQSSHLYCTISPECTLPTHLFYAEREEKKP